MAYKLEDFLDEIEEAVELMEDARLTESEQDFLLTLREGEPRAFLSHNQVLKIGDITLKVQRVLDR